MGVEDRLPLAGPAQRIQKQDPLPQAYHRLLRGRAVAYIQANSERLVVRWEHKAYIYLAFLLLACSLILLKAISG